MGTHRRDFLRRVAGSAGVFVASGTGAVQSLMTAVAPAGPQVEATWRLNVIDALMADKNNVVISILDCQLEGFRKYGDTTRVPYARRSGSGGRIVARVPAAGSYYPGFVLYDGPGDERVSIRIDGVERGVAVANANDNRDRLFFLSEPHQFHGGETIELRPLTDDGLYDTADLILLKEKPRTRQFEYTYSELFAQPEGASAALTWITSWPTLCTVEWGRTGDSRLAKETESLGVSNHRIVLRGLQAGQKYRFRVTAKDRDNRSVASSWQSFSAERPALVAGTVKSERLKLYVVNPAGDGADGEFPVTSGVPFPKGAIGSDRHIRLLNADGRETPLQTRTLAHWPDGSVKWVLLDFQCAQSEGRQFNLEYGTAVRRKDFPSLLRVTPGERAIRISTGPLSFTVDERRLGVLAALSLDDRAVISDAKPGVLELTGNDGTVYSSMATPDEVAVEQSGPLRATVRMKGHYRAADGRKLFAYTVRLHAYAGQRFVRLEHTWANDCGDQEFTTIKSLRLRIPLVTAPGSGGRGYRVGGSPVQQLLWLGEPRPVRLQQHTDDHFTIMKLGEDTPFAEGKRAPGWAEWTDGMHRVTLAVRDFWQTYPKDLNITLDGFELGICPPLRPDEYASAKGTQDDYRLYYYLQDGVYKFRQGMSQTQDIWLEAAPESGKSQAAVLTQRTPLLAIAPAQWYADSKAFGELAGPGEAGLLARYDKAFAHGYEMYQEDREFQRAYGMLNFGDWYGERFIDWGNSEYDTQHLFLMQFVRTGDVRYFLAGEQMEWHNRDVDTIHHHRDTSRIGGVPHHAIGHVGDYYPQSPVPGQGMVKGNLTVDHVFLRGRLAYYFLTGARRSLETARLIADRYDTYDTRNYDFKNCRIAGWHLILTMAMYEATRDRFYLNAAKIIAERALERQNATGAWEFYWPGCGTADERPVQYGIVGFMTGILLTGLRAYHAATDDERVAEGIVRGAHSLVDRLWTPQYSNFRYVSCPRQPAGPSPELTFVLLDGITFAHQRTRDPKLAQILIAATERGIAGLLEMTGADARAEASGSGKAFGLYASNTPHFIGYVATLRREAGET